MKDENSVLGYSGQLKQCVLRAKVPLRAPDNQDKASAWLITIKRLIRVARVTPQGLTFVPSTHLDDKNRASRSGLKASGAVNHSCSTCLTCNDLYFLCCGILECEN